MDYSNIKKLKKKRLKKRIIPACKIDIMEEEAFGGSPKGGGGIWWKS